MKKDKTNIIAERKVSIFLMLIVFTLVQIAFSSIHFNQSDNASTNEASLEENPTQIPTKGIHVWFH